MYGCESWTRKKAEHQRIDAFELWCWRKLLRVPWTARRSNQSILKEISSGCSLVGMMLKLKLQYFGHLMRRADLFEKTLMLGKRRRGRHRIDGWMASLTQWTWVWVGSRSWWWTGRPGVLPFMGSQEVKRDQATELNWTEVLVIYTLEKKKKCSLTMPCGILIPQSGTEPWLPALGAQSPNHWTTMDVPDLIFKGSLVTSLPALSFGYC